MEKNGIVIKTENLTKYYGKTIGIDDLNLEVEKGEVFGFLGPNGAGKTTTINLLLDLIRPTSGKRFVFGMESGRKGREIRQKIGYLPGEFGFYEDMKGGEYLDYFAGLRGIDCKDRINELAEYFFNIDLKRKIKTYSRGMKQILGIIQAFMASPELYILDEPTANLDPLMSQRFYSLVEEEAQRGRTIFLSSHLLHEVERLCFRVCIIKKGKMAALKTIDEIREKMKQTVDVTFEGGDGSVNPDDLMVEGVTDVKRFDGRYRIEVSGSLRQLFAKLSSMPMKTFDYHKMSIEEVFWEYFEK